VKAAAGAGTLAPVDCASTKGKTSKVMDVFFKELGFERRRLGQFWRHLRQSDLIGAWGCQ
jgi:hypothetical protein